MECKCTMRQQLAGDGCEVCNPELAKELSKQTLHEYCAEQMMKTFLAKMSGWTYEMVLERFEQQYPSDGDFRKAMEEIQKNAQAITGTSYSWLDDYDEQLSN